MKKTLKGYLLGFLSATLLLSGVVYAASNTKTIEVIYDNIKVYKDNILCETKDANGNIVEPFIYNGTTYMPVRGTANLAGMDVTWDGATKSVYLWDEMPSTNTTYMMDVCPPYEVNQKVQYINWNNYHSYKEYLLKNTEYFEMAGTKYTNGFTLLDGGAYALFALNGKYSQMEFSIGHVDGTTMSKMPIQFYLDGVLIKEIIITPESLPQKVSLSLNHGLQLKIFTPEDVDGLPYIGFGNITIK